MSSQQEAIDAFNNNQFDRAFKLAKGALQEGYYTDPILRIVSHLEMEMGDPKSGLNLLVKLAEETKTAFWTQQLTHWMGALILGYVQSNGKVAKCQFTEESLTSLLEIITVNFETNFFKDDKSVTASFLNQFGYLGYGIDETPFQSYPQLCKRMFSRISIPRKLVPHSLAQDTAKKEPAVCRFGAYFLSSCGHVDLAEKLMEKISTPFESKEGGNKFLINEKKQKVFASVSDYEIPQIQRTSKKLMQLSEGVEELGDVLDIGCGTGMTSALISNRATSIFGIDQHEQYINAARKKAIYDTLEKIDFFEWDIQDRKFDTIISCMVTCVVLDFEEFIFKISQLLKENGRAYIDVLTCGGCFEQRQLDDYFLRTRKFVEKVLEDNGLYIAKKKDDSWGFAVGTYLEIVKTS